jgi:hypothetical protein
MHDRSFGVTLRRASASAHIGAPRTHIPFQRGHAHMRLQIWHLTALAPCPFVSESVRRMSENVSESVRWMSAVIRRITISSPSSVSSVVYSRFPAKTATVANGGI